MHKVFPILLLCWFLATTLKSQDLKLPVWPKEVPGHINSSIEEVDFENESNIRLVSQISKPSMEVYFPKVKNGSAVVICPGGGYGFLAIDLEGKEIAEWFNEHGITAVVLKSRLPDKRLMNNPTQAPLLDLNQAIKLVRKNAAVWEIDHDRIGVMGFSAGGHLAANVSTHFSDETSRPDFSILVYPVISMDSTFANMYSRKNLIGNSPSDSLIAHYSLELQVNENTPPAFLVVTSDDHDVPVQNSIVYYQALLTNKIYDSELFIGQKGGHGFGLAKNEKSNTHKWPKLCLHWMQENGWTNPKN